MRPLERSAFDLLSCVLGAIFSVGSRPLRCPRFADRARSLRHGTEIWRGGSTNRLLASLSLQQFLNFLLLDCCCLQPRRRLSSHTATTARLGVRRPVPRRTYPTVLTTRTRSFVTFSYRRGRSSHPPGFPSHAGHFPCSSGDRPLADACHLCVFWLGDSFPPPGGETLKIALPSRARRGPATLPSPITGRSAQPYQGLSVGVLSLCSPACVRVPTFQKYVVQPQQGHGNRSNEGVASYRHRLY